MLDYHFNTKHVVHVLLHCIFPCAGNLSLEKSKRKKPCTWLPDQGWEDLVRLSELFPVTFGSLLDDFEKNSAEWKTVSDIY